MLSRPPASLAAAIRRLPSVSSESPSSNSGRSFGSWTIEVRPSEQSRNRSPALAGKMSMSTWTLASGPSARVMTERCGCCSACSSVSLPRATSSPTSEWSLVSRISSPLAQQVGARVADVGDHHLVLVDVGRGRRRAHAAQRVVGARALVDALVGLLDDVHERLGARAVGQLVVERLHRDLRRDLAGLRAAHAVRDHEQGRAHEEVVLVALPLAADVGGVPLLCDAQHWVACV